MGSFTHGPERPVQGGDERKAAGGEIDRDGRIQRNEGGGGENLSGQMPRRTRRLSIKLLAEPRIGANCCANPFDTWGASASSTGTRMHSIAETGSRARR